MPNLHGASIKDIKFTDSLTGYAITSFDSSNTAYLLKTTNGGDNWLTIFTNTVSFQKLFFINSSTGFIGRGYTGGTDLIYKTINGGGNWSIINMPTDGFVTDISAFNTDTIWASNPVPLYGGLFWTSNGGAYWQNIYGGTGNNPEKIYMVNRNLGFMSDSPIRLYRTINGGYNWTLVDNGAWTDIYFIDSLTGWKGNPVDGSMQRTSNGGINWVTQILPYGGLIEGNFITSFSNINKDTIWANVGGIRYPNNRLKYYLLRTTNGGDTWYFQMPDTSFNMYYKYINFVNLFTGWSTSDVPVEIHTTTGGDTTFLLGIKQISNDVPNNLSFIRIILILLIQKQLSNIR